jgi:hypothetical protein
MSKFTDYLNSVNGVAINVDGQFGAQCWDSWSHYATNLIGVSPARLTYTGAGGWHAAHPGFTCAVWFGFDRSGLNQWFTSFGPTVKAQPGDVAIWDYGTPPAPYSHIAIVVEDRGNALYCMTQNPGPNHYGLISKAGLLGYLRPDNQSFFVDGSTPAPAPSGQKTHTIVSGDTLWGLAQSYLGDGTRYMEIFNASNFRSGDPNLIFPGEIAVIP